MLLQQQVLAGGKQPELVTHVLDLTQFGRIYSYDPSSYTNARWGTSSKVVDTGTSLLGQRYVSNPEYAVIEMFLGFDTSVVMGVVQSATLEVNIQANSSATDFTLEARLRDFGTTIEGADFVAGPSLGGLSLMASLAIVSQTGWRALSSEASFKDNINQAGVTRLLLSSSRQRIGNTPTGDEYISLNGATTKARLTVVALVD